MLQPAPATTASKTWPMHLVAGWAAAGVASAGSQLWLASTRSGSVRVEWLADAVDLGRHVGLGLVSALAVGVFRRFARCPGWLGWVVFAAVSLTLGAWCLPTDLDGLAERLSEEHGIPSAIAIWLIVVGIATSIPALAWVTRRRPLGTSLAGRLRRALHLVLVVALAVLAFALNVLVSPGNNPSAHLYLSWATAVLVANSLPRWELRIDPRHTRARLAGAAGVVVTAWALWALFGAHSNSVMIQIARRPNALHLLATLRSDSALDTVRASLAARAGPFFKTRASLAPVPPSAQRPALDRPIAIFFSFDSLRADVPVHPSHRAYLPHFRRLMQAGATFTHARAPGSMTKYTLSSISTGKYFSQQYWTKRGQSRWPTQDESVHFATLLQGAGVFTATFPAMRWLQNSYRIIDGFEQNEWLGEKPPKRYNWTPGEILTEKLLRSLEGNAERSAFYFVHYLDSHDPFHKVRKHGPKFKRYLESLRVVDSYLGQILSALERLGLEDRTLVIASSDHGEAFGEHGDQFHGGSLYDELLRVPLVISGPGVVARQIDVPVSLIDIGPSVLDWFGQPTPAIFMGETLLPLAFGGHREFSRPVVAETKLMQSMVFPDGFKAIRDARRQTLELYDLRQDPGELRNLSDAADLEHEEHVLLLDGFFQVHTFREHGYRVPYVK
jgi:arylsulfatase A-like enzyme